MKKAPRPRQTPRAIVVALAALVVLEWSIAALAQSTTPSAVSVSDDTPFNGQTMHGYAEARFRINNPTGAEHQVTITIPGQHDGGDTIGSVRRTVTVGAGSSATVSLFQPPLSMGYAQQAEVTVDGRRLDPVTVNSGYHTGVQAGRWRGSFEPAVLVSNRVSGPVRAALERIGAAAGSSPFSSGRSVNVTAAPGSPSQWSTHFLGYTRFAALLLTADDLRAAPEPVREAIDRYVEIGGTLIVFGDYTPEPVARRKTERVPHGDAYDKGFGAVLVRNVAFDQLERVPDATWQHWYRLIEASHNAMAISTDVASANARMPIVEALQVPVRAMLMLMFAFAILIGPVNYFVLARRRRQVWLLWTVPAISVVTSLAVFTYAYAAEGWRPRGRSQCVVHLDQGTQRATTLGWLAYYAPLTPSGGLRFDDLSELTPQLGDSGYYRGGGSTRTVDWTSGQHLASGWVTARTPAFFKLRRSQRRLERVTVTLEPGAKAPRVTNGLGATLTSFMLIDDRRACYSADGPIEPGATVTLTTRSVAHGTRELHEHFTGDWLLPEGGPVAPFAWQPNTYQATLDRNPFIEAGLDGLTSNEQATTVLGVLEAPVVIHANYP